MPFTLETAVLELKTQGFSAFQKNIEAMDKSLMGVGKRVAALEKSTVFTQQSRDARTFAQSISKIRTELQKATAATDAFHKKTAASMRPSTLARQRQNAMRAGAINAGETERTFRGVFKDTGIEKLTTEIEKLSRQLTHINREAKSVRVSLGSVAPERVQKQFASINQSAGGLNNNFKNVRYQTLHAGYAPETLTTTDKKVSCKALLMLARPLRVAWVAFRLPHPQHHWHWSA